MRIYELWGRGECASFACRRKGARAVQVRSETGSLQTKAEEKAARRSVPPKTGTNWVRSKRRSYLPCFAYQSALTGVKLFHFSGRSSSAKIAVTGQTGTQAPQSMHSVGWM